MLIKVFEINATYKINAHWRKNYFPMMEINAKEVLKVQNEGNQRDLHVHKATEFVH